MKLDVVSWRMKTSIVEDPTGPSLKLCKGLLISRDIEGKNRGAVRVITRTKDKKIIVLELKNPLNFQFEGKKREVSPTFFKAAKEKLAAEKKGANAERVLDSFHDYYVELISEES